MPKPTVKTLLKLPFASSGRLSERMMFPGKRDFIIEIADSDTNAVERLTFSQVEVLNITFGHAVAPDVNTAYDRLIDVENSILLSTTEARLIVAGIETTKLRHYRLYLDDGPCYDILSHGYSRAPGAQGGEPDPDPAAAE
jgi:hypothetical protein